MYKSKYTFTWKIENFSFCNHNNGVKLLSCTFGSKNFQIIIGSVVLYPRGESKEYSEFISCTLSVLTFEQIDFLQYEIEAIGASGKILKNHKWDKYLTPGDTELKCPDFLAIKDILQDAEDCEEDTLTIRCKFLGQNSTRAMEEEDFSCTKIGVDRNIFEMQVLRTVTKKRLITFGSNTYSEFSISGSSNLKVTFRRVVTETANNEPCIVDCTLTLHDKFNSKIYSERARHYFFSVNCTYWEFPLDTLSKEWKSYLKVFKRNPYHRIHIFCEFSVSNGTYFQIYMPKSDSSSIPNKTASAYSSVQEDLRNLFHTKHLSYVKLRVDGETIEAHKTILVARSPVFAVMFDHQEMEESRSGIVDIVDIDAHVLKSFLKFLYTDTVDEMDYEVATKLLMTAEKYQVLSLKEKCAMFLKKEMLEENVCEILSLADSVNHEFLKSTSIEYIIAKSTTVLSSPQWISWMKNNMESATAIFTKYTLSLSSAKN